MKEFEKMTDQEFTDFCRKNMLDYEAGKALNKAVSDMTRYIDIGEAIKKKKKMHGNESTLLNCYNADWIVSFLEAQPIADVVPSSEIESLQAQIAQLQLDLHYSVCREDEAVARTAKEIFAEIYEDCFDQYGYIDYAALAKLKKKYTGEKEDEQVH